MAWGLLPASSPPQSSGCTSSHHHPGCPHFTDEKIEETEGTSPLAPLPVSSPDLGLCPGERHAVWGLDHGTRAAASLFCGDRLGAFRQFWVDSP